MEKINHPSWQYMPLVIKLVIGVAKSVKLNKEIRGNKLPEGSGVNRQLKGRFSSSTLLHINMLM